jgi:hypothetical protein
MGQALSFKCFVKRTRFYTIVDQTNATGMSSELIDKLP